MDPLLVSIRVVRFISEKFKGYNLRDVYYV